MAKITVFSVSKVMIDKLMEKRHMVHIEFLSQELFDRAVKEGFDKELWEEKNQPNKVQIKKNEH